MTRTVLVTGAAGFIGSHAVEALLGRGDAVVGLDNLDDYYSHRYHSEMDNAVKRRKAVHEDELLAESELGQQVLKLRGEREELLDVVWLATSPKQVKALWEKVAELLGDEQTQLQRDALAIEAVADG